jgi:hypothetical protein
MAPRRRNAAAERNQVIRDLKNDVHRLTEELGVARANAHNAKASAERMLAEHSVMLSERDEAIAQAASDQSALNDYKRHAVRNGVHEIETLRAIRELANMAIKRSES